MKKNSWLLILLISSSTLFAQTTNERLNGQLQEMKKFFLAGDYENLLNYTYPGVFEMMGGKENMIKATEQSMSQIKNDGFTFIDLNFKNPSDFLRKGGELQCTLTQVFLMDTPNGKMGAEYALICISKDDGRNWKFIDSGGNDKATMLSYFSNLHKDLVIKPKKQTQIGENTEISAPKEEKENQSDSFAIDSNDNNSLSEEQALGSNEIDENSAAYKLGALMGRISAMVLTLLILVGLPLLIVYLVKKKKARQLKSNDSLGSKTLQSNLGYQKNRSTSKRSSSFKSAKTIKKKRLETEEQLKTKAAEEVERQKKRKEKEDPSRFMPK